MKATSGQLPENCMCTFPFIPGHGSHLCFTRGCSIGINPECSYDTWNEGLLDYNNPYGGTYKGCSCPNTTSTVAFNGDYH